MKRLGGIWLSIFAIPALLSASTIYAKQVSLFPHQGLYPIYVADPLRPTFNAQIQQYGHSSIANTGNDRFDLKLGANLLLYQTMYLKQPWQWVLLGGFHGQFDNTQSQDNIGWDGIYGLSLVTRSSPQLAWRLGVKHISAHVGDELMERTGRARLGYTREELRLGLAWSPQSRTTVYSEAGYGYVLRNTDLQKPWRFQLGAQYQSSTSIWQPQIHWYTALDLSTYQENQWRLNTTLQLGFAAHTDNHVWRLGLEFYDGRSQLGEFFQNREQYSGLGLWFDL